MVGMRLAKAEEKWARNVMAAKDFWLQRIKSAASFDEYVKGVAEVTGLSEAEIRASLPAKNWEEFQRNADIYVDKWLANIRRAAEKHKWSEGYVGAFRRKA